MANQPLPPPEFRFPFALANQPPEVQQAHAQAFNAILDLQRAIKSLKGQIGTSTTTTINSSSGGGGGGSAPTPFPFPGLGGINDQTGNVTYTIASTDNGIFLLLGTSSAVTVTLNSALTTPYFLFASNFGTANVTLTPSTGLINQPTLDVGGLYLIAFDGANWKASALLTPTPTFVDADIPTPATDGVTTIFTLPSGAPSPAKSLILTLGGLAQDQGAGLDYTLSGATITYATAPAAALNHVAWFRK